ncbi:unnamed protein product, partial [Echinostoma caproni]|uniref:Trimethylguanosine synthase n=1 Tax=Echinostoma caproni TaxID=27848 RepID=A0A183ALZ2_9TREM
MMIPRWGLRDDRKRLLETLSYMAECQAWFSVTPECIARRQAQVCATDLVIDAYAGVGGNSIQFANTCGLVLAIEHNMSRIQLLEHNAKIYGVASRILLICGDVEKVLRSLRRETGISASGETVESANNPCSSPDESVKQSIGPVFPIVFMSPPWGGPGYTGVVLPPGSSSWNTRKRRQWFALSMNAVEPTKNLEEL